MLIGKFLHKTSILKNKQYLITTSQQLQDWQYTSQIHTHLRNGNLNSALSSLIDVHVESQVQSYLNGQVLDIQTYNSMHQTIKEQQLDISYHQILYQLYRQAFKPHFLMLEWMKLLLECENQQVKDKVKADFETLKINLPDTSTTETTEQSTQPESFSQSGPQEEKPKQEQNQKQPHPRINHQIEPEQIKLIIQSLLSKYSKVTIHDVEISCENYIEEDEEHQGQGKHDYEQQYADEEGEQFVTSISKIKIGRIEIQDPKPDDDKDGDII